MIENIFSPLPALPVTRYCYPTQNESTILKVIKLAGFIFALPIFLLADLCYAAFSFISNAVRSKPPELLPAIPENSEQPAVIEPSVVSDPEPVSPLLIEEQPNSEPMPQIVVEVNPEPMPHPVLPPLIEEEQPNPQLIPQVVAEVTPERMPQPVMEPISSLAAISSVAVGVFSSPQVLPALDDRICGLEGSKIPDCVFQENLLNSNEANTSDLNQPVDVSQNMNQEEGKEILPKAQSSSMIFLTIAQNSGQGKSEFELSAGENLFSVSCCLDSPEKASDPIEETRFSEGSLILEYPIQDSEETVLGSPSKKVRFADSLPRKEQQKPVDPPSSSSSSSSSEFDQFFDSLSSYPEHQPTSSMKMRVSSLVAKKSICLGAFVRSEIINGIAGIRSPNKFCSEPVFQRRGGFRIFPKKDNPEVDPETLPWDVSKLLSDLESMYPYISYGSKTFESLDGLLQVFGTSQHQLSWPNIQMHEDKIKYDKLVSTLCCLTNAACKSCLDRFREELEKVEVMFPKIQFGENPKPQVQIKVERGVITIEVSYHLFLRDPKNCTRAFPLTAVLTMNNQEGNYFELKPRLVSSSSPLHMSLIGGGSAGFKWRESKGKEEDIAPVSIMQPDDDSSAESWFSWDRVASWANNTVTYTRSWTDYLSHALFHQPHVAQDYKYHLALSTEIAALNAWLRIKVSSPNMIENFLKNLHAALKGDLLEDPYNDLFGKKCQNSLFVENLICALTALSDETLPIRIRNAKYLASLREALQSDEYKGNDLDFVVLKELLQELCWQRFTGNRMENYERALLALAIKGTPETLYCNTVANAIATGNERLQGCSAELKKAPQDGAWQKISNSTGFWSDPTGKSNVPELRSIHIVQRGSETYPILYMRHGTPTYQPQSTSPEAIVPEYRGFLDAAKKYDKNVLYVNHQKMWPGKWLWGIETQAEYERACAINALEKDYPGTFHFLSLPYDGEIWSKSMLAINPTIRWKNSIVDALLNEQHGFKLPEGFLTAETKETERQKFLNMANALHKCYFSDVDSIELDFKKRKIFLTIFYSYVKEVMKERYKIEVMASPCKDCKDRGNVSTGIDEVLINLRLGLENSPEELEQLYVRTLAPFIIKYEGILSKRLEPLLHLLDHISNLREHDKTNIKEYNPAPGYCISNEKKSSLLLAPSLIDIASEAPWNNRLNLV